MHTARRASVRVSLAYAILVAIVLSWVLSGGIANYFNYVSVRSLRQEMLRRPDLYPRPIPEPRFGVMEFLIGRPPLPPPEKQGAEEAREAPQPRGQQPGGQQPDVHAPGPQPGQPPAGTGEGHTPPPPPQWPDTKIWLVRLVIAVSLAAAAAAWLERMFTKPLMQLARGAQAFHSGDFAYRIPTTGRSEFAAVATAMNEMARQVSGHISHLEEEAERRRKFLADTAHELRSPVTTMRTMAGALQDGLADEPARRDRAISALVRTSERLLRLVQDLMELAKLDLNELPLTVRQGDLRELAESAVLSHLAEAGAAGIVLHAPEPSRPVKIVADPDRLAQVLDNILGNAISYAGEGAEVWVQLEDGDPVRLTIRDSGQGIRPEDLPYIFDSFYRADAARTPGDGHSGLGLSIARRLVQAHGGDLTVCSEEGKGTTVTIQIPRPA